MLFNSAVFGEVNSGHALRAASGDSDFARSIAGRLDLPSNPPPGVSWSPTISGFPVDGRYVVARTFLDTSAPRANMVCAHAVFGPIEEVQRFAALSALFERLASQIDEISAPTAFEVSGHDATCNTRELVDVASLLVSRAHKPVVKLDCDGFEQLVSALWLNLWPDMRRDFAFRLSFGPDDVYETPAPALVWTPRAMAVRWHGYPILGQGAAPRTSIAGAVLAGTATATDMMDFANSIGVAPTSLLAFSQLGSAMELAGPSAGVDELAGAMRLIDHLSPSPQAGVSAKKELAQRLAAMIATANGVQIMGLRNFSLLGFPEQKVIWKAIEGWMDAQLPQPEATVLSLADVIASSQDAEGVIEAWRRSIQSGGRLLASRRPKDFSRAFWILLRSQPELAGALLAIVPGNPTGEASLVGAMPRELNFSLVALRAALIALGWLELHGAVLAASETPIDAVHEQLRVDRAPDVLAGLKAALSRAGANDKISIALSLDDPRLDSIAGAAIVGDHSLLAGLDHHRLGVQRLWAEAIRLDPDAWRAPADPLAARNDILTARLDQGDACGPLIALFSQTPLSDLSDFNRRAEVWDLADDTAAFLQSTAAGWVRSACAGSAPELDQRLEQAVLHSAPLSQRLSGSDVDCAINLVVALSGIDEDRVVAWFDGVAVTGRPFTQPQAEQLGHIILERRWFRLLDRIKDSAVSRPELRATLGIGASMLSPITRWSMGISDVGVDDKWESFARIAADLYPAGPDQNAVWERCGGKDADLPRFATGQSAWRTVTQLVRRGRGPLARDLIAEMIKDYPNNADLRFVAGDKDITVEVLSDAGPRGGPWWRWW